MVDVAPSIVYQKEGELNAYKVSGLIDSSWLLEKSVELIKTEGALKDGELYDLGIYGPVVRVIEEDLVEDMKARVLAYDWDKAKKRAVQSYFDKLNFVDLPMAEKNAERTLDLTLTVKKDIFDDKGNRLAKKGLVVDPAKYMSLSKYIVVFTPMDKREMAFAKMMKTRAENDNKGIKYIITQMDKKRGAAHMGEIMNSLEHQISFLSEFFKNRFDIRSTPSVIYMKDNEMMIQEVEL